MAAYSASAPSSAARPAQSVDGAVPLGREPAQLGSVQVLLGVAQRRSPISSSPSSVGARVASEQVDQPRRPGRFPQLTDLLGQVLVAGRLGGCDLRRSASFMKSSGGAA